MNIETVNELITSLESAGELSIREQKFLKLAKAFKQLAAENYLLKSAHPQPFGPEMMKALDAYEKQQDEVPETGMLDAFFILRDSIRLETPATDAYLAGIKADAIDEAAVELDRVDTVASTRVIGFKLRDFSQQLREGAK
ncbi:hypothetical protein [Klebsiella pneumoniae]|uniref:hypothetical protein n=1 Tax=Klebsiella pneumoniae TaxID=573 RepID=UPI001D0DF8B5|nr:hypothetical protein [Klebsiella pneumoniae]